MAVGIRVMAASVAAVAALAPAVASAQAPTSTGAVPPRSSIQTRTPSGGSGVVRPSTESDDVTRLLLVLLAGLVVLVVIPMQIAKGVAERRRRDALATARARRPRRRR